MIACCVQALRYLEEVPKAGADAVTPEQVAEQWIPCSLNRAACYLKLGNKASVVDDTTAVLAHVASKPTDRVKALYRRAQVCVMC